MPGKHYARNDLLRSISLRRKLKKARSVSRSKSRHYSKKANRPGLSEAGSEKFYMQVIPHAERSNRITNLLNMQKSRKMLRRSKRLRNQGPGELIDMIDMDEMLGGRTDILRSKKLFKRLKKSKEQIKRIQQRNFSRHIGGTVSKKRVREIANRFRNIPERIENLEILRRRKRLLKRPGLLNREQTRYLKKM